MMNPFNFKINLVFLFLLMNQAIKAQEYTDFNPAFKPSRSNLMLDRIEHKGNNTIVHVRYVIKADKGEEVKVYPPSTPNSWYLMDVSDKTLKEIPIKEVRYVCLNGLTKYNNLHQVYTPTPNPGTVITAQLFFPKLNASVKEVNLIEGKDNMSKLQFHHAYNIKVKPKNDKTNGNPNDMIAKVKTFERSHRVNEYTEFTNVDWTGNSEEETTSASEKRNATPPVLKPVLVYLVTIKFAEDGKRWSSIMLADQYLNFTAKYLEEHPKSTIKINGHADLFAKNPEQLAKERAETVKQAILTREYKQQPDKMSIVSHGSSSPVVDRGNGHNRRVQIEIWDVQ